jgi:hypothetical protein
MAKRMKTIVALVVALQAHSPMMDAQVAYRSYGAGLSSCRGWSNARQQPSAHLIHLSWVQGFVSGVASDGRELPEMNFFEVQQWIDDYCQQNPLDTIARAATALVGELATR